VDELPEHLPTSLGVAVNVNAIPSMEVIEENAVMWVLLDVTTLVKLMQRTSAG
jgi:hypothetical protein